MWGYSVGIRDIGEKFYCDFVFTLRINDLRTG